MQLEKRIEHVERLITINPKAEPGIKEWGSFMDKKPTRKMNPVDSNYKRPPNIALNSKNNSEEGNTSKNSNPRSEENNKNLTKQLSPRAILKVMTITPWMNSPMLSPLNTTTEITNIKDIDEEIIPINNKNEDSPPMNMERSIQEESNNGKKRKLENEEDQVISKSQKISPPHSDDSLNIVQSSDSTVKDGKTPNSNERRDTAKVKNDSTKDNQRKDIKEKRDDSKKRRTTRRKRNS